MFVAQKQALKEFLEACRAFRLARHEQTMSNAFGMQPPGNIFCSVLIYKSLRNLTSYKILGVGGLFNSNHGEEPPSQPTGKFKLSNFWLFCGSRMSKLSASRVIFTHFIAC
jgi:hypothetical protein